MQLPKVTLRCVLQRKPQRKERVAVRVPDCATQHSDRNSIFAAALAVGRQLDSVPGSREDSNTGRRFPSGL